MKAKKFLKIFSSIFLTILLLTITIPWIIPISKAQKHSNDFNPFNNSEFVEIDGVKLHYRVWLNGDKNKDWILFIHGMGSSTYSWENNTDFFYQNGFNIVAVDVPPFGYSDKNPELNNSIDELSKLLWNFTRIFDNSGKWILIGHSMGGAIVQCMSVMKPYKVSKAVFVSPGMFKELTPQKNFSSFIIGIPLIQRIIIIIGDYFIITEKNVSKMLLSAYGKEVPEETVREYLKTFNQKGFAQAFVKTFGNAKIKQNVNGLNFKTKSLLFAGGKDTWVPYEKYKNIYELFPQIKTVLIEDAGHCIMETHPEEFNKITLDFLRE
ncbi:MAG: alpha/beta hydrolase [Endomicrobiia bacterium]